MCSPSRCRVHDASHILRKLVGSSMPNMHASMQAHTHTHLRVELYVYIYIYIYIHTYTPISVYLYLHLHTHVYGCLCACTESRPPCAYTANDSHAIATHIYLHICPCVYICVGGGSMYVLHAPQQRYRNLKKQACTQSCRGTFTKMCFKFNVAVSGPTSLKEREPAMSLSCLHRLSAMVETRHGSSQ